VVIDDGGAHQRDQARQAIEARGCRVLFPPASSPDRSPIEEACSKITACLRRAGARTRAELEAASGAALRRVTAADARGRFTPGGSPIPAPS
jgi:hypothetical protein